jgi:hypothetical protein
VLVQGSTRSTNLANARPIRINKFGFGALVGDQTAVETARRSEVKRGVRGPKCRSMLSRFLSAGSSALCVAAALPIVCCLI